jgi:hypothetical protein
LPKTQDDARMPIGRESCLFHPDFVSTDSKLFCPKETLPIRAYTARLIRQRVVQRNLRVGNDSAGGVAYNALKDRSDSRRLSVRIGSAKQKQNRSGNINGNTTHKKQTAMTNHLGSSFPQY